MALDLALLLVTTVSFAAAAVAVTAAELDRVLRVEDLVALADDRVEILMFTMLVSEESVISRLPFFLPLPSPEALLLLLLLIIVRYHRLELFLER